MRREYNGHPAETPTDKLAQKGGLHGDVTHTSPIPHRTGRKGGTLVYSLPAGPGHRSWARKPGTRKKHTEKKNRKEHSVIVMFPYISMPVRSTISMRTFNFLTYYE